MTRVQLQQQGLLFLNSPRSLQLGTTLRHPDQFGNRPPSGARSRVSCTQKMKSLPYSTGVNIIESKWIGVVGGWVVSGASLCSSLDFLSTDSLRDSADTARG